MHFAAWNKSTYVDLIVLITKVLVAAALIAHAHFIQSHLRPEPVYGVLDNADYAHSVQETEGISVKVSWIAGGYVLISSAIGLLGRFLRAAPLYGFYYCANVLGFGVCLAAAIIPTLWGTSKVGYCLAAETSCMAVEDLAACPYPVTFTSDGRGRVLAEGNDAAAGAGEGLTSSSPCCYLPEFVRFCGTFLGAVYMQTIIAVVLLALVMTQSMVSCWYLCCDCDRRKCYFFRFLPPSLPPSLPSSLLPSISRGVGLDVDYLSCDCDRREYILVCVMPVPFLSLISLPSLPPSLISFSLTHTPTHLQSLDSQRPRSRHARSPRIHRSYGPS